MADAARQAMLMFAKYPTPGQVKSRLTPALTPKQAAAVHAACARATWHRLGQAEFAEPVLVHAPDDSGDAWPSVLDDGDRARRWEQGDGDLGERLARAFRRSFAEGFTRVVAVGCDSPMITAARIHEGFARLADSDVVIGPTEDGGYYLIGLSGRAGLATFEDVDWGTDRVAAQTRERVQDAGLRLAELPIGYDVDRPADLARMRDELARAKDDPIATELVRSLCRTFDDHALTSESRATP